MVRPSLVLCTMFWVVFAATGKLRAAEDAPVTPHSAISVMEAPQETPARVDSTTPSESAYDRVEPGPSPDLFGVRGQDVTPSAETRSIQHWYGWQTLTTDGAALTLAFGGAALGSPTALYVVGSGEATYFLGGPIVHVTHGRWGAAAGSLALRIALPAAFALLGHELDPCRPNDDSDLCGVTGPALGAVLGIGAAIALDSAVLAREELHTSTAPSLATRLSPIIAIDRKRAFLGVGGSF